MKKIILLIFITITLSISGFAQQERPLNAPSGLVIPEGKLKIGTTSILSTGLEINRAAVGIKSNSQTQLDSIKNALKTKTDTTDWVLGYSAAEIDSLLLVVQPTLLRDLKLIGSTIKSIPYGATTYGATGSAITSGRFYGVMHIVRDTITVTGVEYGISNSPALVDGGYNGFDVCSYSAGVVTKITETADGDVFASFGYFRKAFPAPIVLNPGIYFVRAMCNGTGTLPALTFAAQAAMGDLTTILGTSVRTSFYKSSETTLVSPFTLSGGSGSSLPLALHLY